MDQLMVNAITRIVLGPTGHRLPIYPDIQSAYIDGLLADYYACHAPVGVKTCYKYITGAVPPPHFWGAHYRRPDGYHRIQSNMTRLVNASPSLIQLRQIQSEVYDWVSGYLPAVKAASVCRHYVAQDATREDIAVYLADIWHYALTCKT